MGQKSPYLQVNSRNNSIISQNWYHSITTKDIVKNSVPCKSVMITFDDGYYDVYKNAFPLMKEVNYTGVVAFDNLKNRWVWLSFDLI